MDKINNSQKVLVRIGNEWLFSTKDDVEKNIREIGLHCYDEILYEKEKS